MPKEHLPANLINHYVRGVFDGDDSYCSMGRANAITIAGTKKLLEDIQEILPVKSYIYKHSGEVHILRITKIEYIQSFASWLYKDAKIWLQRKRQLFGV